jgi:uncharacterized protein YgiM (DUF1202 family)
MKPLFRLFTILILIALIAIPLAAQTVTYVSPKFDSLNVRMGPGIEHGVVTELFGSINQYPVVGRSATGNWLLIDLGYARGWVHQAYVIETNYSGALVVTAPTTTAANFGQGGGFAAPQYTVPQTNYYTYTVPATTASLGQGGGFAAPTTNVTQTQFAGDFNSTVGSWVSLNLRRGPGAEFGVVAIMPQGDRATPIGRNARGTWYLINYSGVQGWVTHELVAVPPSIDVVALPVVSNQ